MAYELLTWKAWTSNAKRDEIAEKLALQQAEIVRLRGVVSSIEKTIARLRELAASSDITQAKAVREAGR